VAGEHVAFLGRGWAFPPAATADGSIAMASDEEDVRQAIRIVLATNRGERAMRPEFGADLRALQFQPLSTTTLSLLRHRVEDALVRWEPRIDVIAVRADADAARPGLVLVEIDYRVRTTNTFYNLVYPFYLLEGDPA
jgi:phage baseplate assembly protein W